MINYKITLEYDGSKYNGWQRQGNTDNTIQGRIETILARFFNQPVELHGSGRTDAGVHAMGQVANFKILKSSISGSLDLYDTDSILKSLNSFLPEDIRILYMSIEDNRFHARLNAKTKHYRYRICITEKKSVFQRKYCAQISYRPDISVMSAAASLLLGEHDFAGFSDSRTKKSTVRRIDSITFSEENVDNDHYITVDFIGNGFLYHTVRLIMGTLIRIGLGQCNTSLISDILSEKNRKLVPYMAPAEGLFLVRVFY